jgi:hypothetical protein
MVECGLVFRIKYADASGKQVMETVGAERDGFTRKDAETALRHKLTDVERKNYRKPEPLRFRAAWSGGEPRRASRRVRNPPRRGSNVSILARLNDYFGSTAIGATRPSHVSAYKVQALDSYSAASVSRDLSILHSALHEPALLIHQARGARSLRHGVAIHLPPADLVSARQRPLPRLSPPRGTGGPSMNDEKQVPHAGTSAAPADAGQTPVRSSKAL